jgi:dihydroflavonol-4-reductase
LLLIYGQIIQEILTYNPQHLKYNPTIMNVFIIGGTGFIGYHAVLEFIRRGHRVSVLALPPIPEEVIFPPEVKVQLADFNQLPDEDIRALFYGHDALVFAAGADDRVIPQAPAEDFFYTANVHSCKRLFTLAKEAGIKRGILTGSYFAHFDRIWPRMTLAVHHPYIASRVAQIDQTMEVAKPDLELMVLELPYIFGSMPGRVPLWKPLIRYIRYPIPLFYPRGGTNVIAVEHVAEAIVGAVESGVGGEIYQVGDENLTWVEMLTRLSKAVGKKKWIITLPDWSLKLGMWFVKVYHRFQGREGGLDPVPFTELQVAETYFDPAPSRESLGYGQGGLDQAFQETVDACLK